ncbi:MAG: Na+/H+ antiporter NhaA [Actinomycetota bacterium]|nr:Na+/H+ antiporter NhaA [Actinomycetota bacterium]
MSSEPNDVSSTSGDRRIERNLLRPVREFLDTEVAGAGVLLAATIVALVWANSPLGASYETLWATKLMIGLGRFVLEEDLRHWVNDGLMVIFFFVIGLEIKRELVQGELNELKKAALPAIAAVGGMIVPALLFLALNRGTDAAAGWGIPMATDIAFALGALALFGRRVPSSLRVFLLSLAIVDDVGAILVIALFYSEGIQAVPLLLAVAGIALVVLMRRVGIWWVPIYVVVGTGIWLATLISGVHATIAGVALGLVTPAHPLDPASLERMPSPQHAGALWLKPEIARAAKLRVQEAVPVAERLAHALHPWTSYLVIPVFALANAGVTFGATGVGEILASSVTQGVILGLVVGKVVGIWGFARVAQRLGVVRLPEGISWMQIAAAASFAGIGFTVSLFITDLAFSDEPLVSEAKIGILVASVLAAILGSLVLRISPGKYR